MAGLADQAEQRQLAEAERGRLAAREERVRIARELHDVVAHTLSMVTVQAGVGRKVGTHRPAEALRALRAVEVSGRAAVGEVRRILGLLRDDDTQRPSLNPVPGIGELAELAASVRSAGMPVELQVSGDDVTPPPTVGMNQAIVRAGFRLLIKSEQDLAVLSAIRVIAAGEALLAPNITHRLIGHFARQPDPQRPRPSALAQLPRVSARSRC